MMRAIHLRVPKRTNRRLDEISEQRVAEKKQSAAKPIDGGGEMQIRIHALGGGIEIDTVHERDPVADRDQGQEPLGDIAQRCGARGRRRIIA